ncbi:MAG: alpha/beta hydrolase, partial [Hungatella sp.]|nr:alpha/beta hydrolase [Hungatella sp.]
MVKKNISIKGIPAILWGNDSTELFIAVHGNMSSKSDIPIRILAEEAVPSGYQVLSFDLPEHGDRKNEPTLCNVRNCVSDLKKVLTFASARSNLISLWANSMGAYFSLLAYKDEAIKQSLFLSPVVDMSRVIQNMMKWFDVTEEQLCREKEVSTPIGQTLYWDYYQYVINNPIIKWKA